jgi:hypothetical protein
MELSISSLKSAVIGFFGAIRLRKQKPSERPGYGRFIEGVMRGLASAEISKHRCHCEHYEPTS